MGKSVDNNQEQIYLCRYSVIFNLFILMGVSWTTEVVSFVLDGSFYSWFFTDLINSLMGFIIFVNFVCKARIGRLLIQNCSCLNKLFSSFEFVRGRTLPGRRSPESQAATVSMSQKMRNSSNNESSNSHNTTHSAVLIRSNGDGSGTKRLLHQNASPLRTASSGTHHRVICNSSTQSNQIIEATSL